MKLDLNKFYNTNYKDFVHKEAIEEALRMVAEIELKDVEVDTILSITFSVDEYGENPMYIEYLDKDGKTHLVRIRPAVSNEIQDLLKRYVTLEQHETDKQDIYNHFEHMHVPMEIRSQNGLDAEGNKFIVLNNDNSYLSLQVDPETDDEIQWLCIHNKGGLGSQSMYFARFMDYAKVDQVPSNADFLEKIHQLEELIHRKSQETLQNSKEYTDKQDYTQRNAVLSIMVESIDNVKNEITNIIDVKYDELKAYVDAKDEEYHELSKRYTDNSKEEAVQESKNYADGVADVAIDRAAQYTETKMQEAVSTSKTYTDSKADETLIASKNYTDTKHTETMQQITELGDEVKPKINSLEENQVKLVHSQATQRALTDSIVFGETNGKLNWLQLLKKTGEEGVFNVENFKNDILASVPSLPTNTVTTEVLNSTLLDYVKNSQLSNYYTKTESDNRYAFKGEVPDVPEGVVTNDKLTEVLNNYYTKILSDNKYAQKTELLNYYTKGESSNKYAAKTELSNYYNKTESDNKYALKTEIPTSVDVKVNNTNNATKVNYQTSDNSVEVFSGSTSLMKGKFITDVQAKSIDSNLNKLSLMGENRKVPEIYWYPDTAINFIRLLRDGNYIRAHLANPEASGDEITYLPKFKSASETALNDLASTTQTNVANLTQSIQEVATMINNAEIGERTKINFKLFNNELGGTTDPTLLNNESYYVKVGKNYLISVYLTFKVNVTPTSSSKLVTCGMEQDIPAGNPYLTLTSTITGRYTNYSNTRRIPTNQNFVQFYLPPIPATDTFQTMEITIYGSAITKDLAQEAENND